MQLFAVIVGDKRGRDEPVRVELGRREDHLVGGHKQELVLQVLLLLLQLIVGGVLVDGTGHV